MKKRMSRIWDDILNKLPAKLKCLQKNSQQSSSVSKVYPSQSEVEVDDKPKRKEAKVNKGYQENEVHPFQITE